MASAVKRSVKTEKIIAAATKLFARQGYHGTSTRQIAHLAGVSENTLFRQFNHKEELFWSALHYHSSGVKLCPDLVDGLTQCDPPQVILPKILDVLSETASYKPELLRLVAVAYIELQWKADGFGNDHLSLGLLQISQYLQTNIQHGKLRRVDACILTTALMMTTLAHPGFSKLTNRQHALYQNSLEAGRAHTRFWLDLLVPGLSPAAVQSSACTATL